MEVLKRAENGGSFVKGRTNSGSTKEATSVPKSAQFRVLEDYRSRSGYGVRVKLSAPVVLTVQSSSTRLFRKRNAKLSSSSGTQSLRWLEHLRKRKRKPVAPGTIDDWERILRNLINLRIGNCPISDVNNKTLGITWSKE